MLAELVHVATSDEIRLDGALHGSPSDTRPLIVCLHGVGGNFYGGTLFAELLQPIRELGHPVLWANTRGHDMVSFSGSPGPPLGAAFELVSDCIQDFDAWNSWASKQGFSAVIYLGHSLGAIKAVYAQSKSPAPFVKGLIAASPPRLSHQTFQHGTRSSLFFEDMQTAKKLVNDGLPQQLFRCQVPYPLVISAATYIDKYGPSESYNILNQVDQLTTPALFTYGQLELDSDNVAFAGIDDAIRDKTQSKEVEVVGIAGANHAYSGCRRELAEAICEWLSKQT